jgi:transcriptional regulator with XRE-family HTH domain
MAKHSIALQLGKTLRARRQGAGMSQDDFADHIGMHRAYYAAIERGEKNVTLKTLKRISEGLDATMAEILQDVR